MGMTRFEEGDRVIIITENRYNGELGKVNAIYNKDKEIGDYYRVNFGGIAEAIFHESELVPYTDLTRALWK